MIVVDANIIAYFLIAGPKSDLARRLRGHDPVWCVPDLWCHEFLNILVTYNRVGGATLKECAGIWETAIRLLHGRSYPIDGQAALKLAAERRVTGYDAQYLLLADALDAVCVTEDKKLWSAYPGRAVSMDAYLSA